MRHLTTTLFSVLIIRSNRCDLEYQRIVETTADVAPIMQKAAVPVQRPSIKRQREEESESDDEPSQFRRVRIKCRQRARKQRSAGEAGLEAFESGEETIRCICGTQHDFGLCEENSILATSTRTIGAWLIQCGACNVWQHRSCVGTANGRKPVGGFYCEHCLPHVSNPRLVPVMHRLGPLQNPPQNILRKEELGPSKLPEVYVSFRS